ncbi:hypothetical protein [Ammoniphilus sp. 3BR4]|uniref:hypothetical protein n=1 Tax=Ammoniphilus sp. 3BR4 TaxID=3158265 RepID=UPI0034654B31
METVENLWAQLPKEKREKAASIITEFSTMAVSWNDEERDKTFHIFSNWISSAQEEFKIKPHQLIVIAKMLQETAFADLIEWLPENFEEWEDKDELMTLFFFGSNGLERYKEAKKKVQAQ